jgi:hypothetical protein
MLRIVILSAIVLGIIMLSIVMQNRLLLLYWPEKMQSIDSCSISIAPYSAPSQRFGSSRGAMTLSITTLNIITLIITEFEHSKVFC